MDVGQGDAFFIATPNKKYWLVDTGYGRYKKNPFDKAVSVIVPYLRYQGVQQLEGLILSHLDADHAGGIFSLKAHFPIKQVYVSSQARVDRLPKDIPLRRLYKNDRLALGQAVWLDVLGPSSEPLIASKNNRSLILRLSYKDFDALLMGDAESAIERKLLKKPRVLENVEVLKVGHHGSKTSSVEPFLAAISPQVALLSAGRFNRYGHPHNSVVSRLNRFCKLVFRTDLHGFASIRSNGFVYSIKTFLK